MKLPLQLSLLALLLFTDIIAAAPFAQAIAGTVARVAFKAAGKGAARKVAVRNAGRINKYTNRLSTKLHKVPGVGKHASSAAESKIRRELFKATFRQHIRSSAKKKAKMGFMNKVALSVGGVGLVGGASALATTKEENDPLNDRIAEVQKDAAEEAGLNKDDDNWTVPAHRGNDATAKRRAEEAELAFDEDDYAERPSNHLRMSEYSDFGEYDDFDSPAPKIKAEPFERIHHTYSKPTWWPDNPMAQVMVAIS